MSVNKVNSDGSLSRVAGGTLYADLAVGSIVPFGGSTAPNGFLFCNGAEVLKTAYAELYAVIGDAFGTSSVNTKFVLPDLRETVPVGSGTRGSGVATHDLYGLGQFKDDQLQNHNHEVTSVNGQAFTDYVGGGTQIVKNVENYSASAYASPLFAGSIITGRNGTTTHGKQLGVNYIIKAKQVAVPADFTDYVKDFIKSELVNIDVPAQSGIGEYTVTKTLAIPTGYKFLAFGSVSCVHYNQVLMSALFNDTTNVASIRIYNDYGAIIALANAVKAWVLYVKA